MGKKILISLAVVLCAIFSFTVCFAADNEGGLGKAANDVRNVVGGVEDTIENAALDVSNTSKDMTGGIEDNMNGNKNNTRSTTKSNNDGKYTTSRVNTGNSTAMGMSSTAWTWIILAIAAIAIIDVVWYYSMQFTNNNTHNNHNDE